jgi:hypothetical protein
MRGTGIAPSSSTSPSERVEPPLNPDTDPMKNLSTLGLIQTLALVPLAACVTGLATSSCSMMAMQGSGIEAEQVREVGSFERVHVSGSANVVVRVGGEPGLTLRGDDNLLEYVVTEVRGDTLWIGMESGSYSFHTGLDVEVSVPELSGLSLAGSSEASVSGLQGSEFSASISGSGVVRASGHVDRLESRVSGSGDMDFSEVQARQVRVAISGSADVIVQASESLDVSISGSGDVRYVGQPQVSKSISGSGSVSRR